MTHHLFVYPSSRNIVRVCVRVTARSEQRYITRIQFDQFKAAASAIAVTDSLSLWNIGRFGRQNSYESKARWCDEWMTIGWWDSLYS